MARELGRTPEIDAALEPAGDREQWHRGREAFDSPSWSVAEVAHNAAGPPPYFDHHAGWQIGPLARPIAATAQDPHRIEALLGLAD